MGEKEPKKATEIGVSKLGVSKLGESELGEAAVGQAEATHASASRVQPPTRASATPSPTTRGHLKARNIAREIFEAESPEQVIKSIPAQSLFLAVKQQGLLSSTDLLAITSVEQMRTLLDLDLWHKDSFIEEQLWEWLALADDENGLTLLQRLLNCVDLKLLGILLCRYATAHIADEPTDEPPGPDYYTPDKGFTWIRVDTGNADNDFLLNRFLALVFETSTEVFYQLISVPGVTTTSVLEEDSYVERSKRLLADGIPDEEFAAQLNQPLPPYKIKEQLGSQERRYRTADIAIVSPILAEGQRTSILDRFISECGDAESAESELCLLANGALVHWGVFIDDYEEFLFTIDRVKSILTLGLESLAEFAALAPVDIYEKLSLKEIYGLGLFHLYELRKFAHKIDPRSLENIGNGPDDISLVSGLALIAGARERIPVVPTWFGHDGQAFVQNEDLSDQGEAGARLKAGGATNINTVTSLASFAGTSEKSEESEQPDDELTSARQRELIASRKLRADYRAISSLTELRAIKQWIEDYLIRRVN